MTKVLGIDEAGRGPVIGPLVMAGVMIEEGREKMLGEVKDSKLISHKKRLKLDKHLRENFSHKIVVTNPKEIDSALNSTTLNLNWLEAHKQAEIINTLQPDIAIIDCPGANPTKFKDYLKNLLNNKSIKLIIEHKADINYPVCSAASILAKVERENQMKKIQEKYGDTGPGYPANQKTRDFVKNNWDKYPEIFRKTWATYKKISEQEKKYQRTLL